MPRSLQRANVPSILAASTAPATINTSAWGVPTAEFPADDCAIESFFGPQRLVLTITVRNLPAMLVNALN